MEVKEGWCLVYSCQHLLDAGGLCDGEAFEELPLVAETEEQAVAEAKVRWAELKREYRKHYPSVVLNPTYLYIRHSFTFKRISV